MRNARSSARATSRCEIQRTLPRFVYRSRTGNRRAAPHDGTHRRLRCRGTGPGCRAPRDQVLAGALAAARRARPARPPRARGRSRCTPHSRSRASTGNRGARARPGPLASPARGSRGGGRPRCGPRAAPRRAVRCRVTYQSGSRPSACIASIQRSSAKCSLHSWNVPPARQTALDDPSDAPVAAARDALRRTSRPGRATSPAHVVPLRRVAQQADLAAQLLDAVLAEPLERRVRLRARTRRPTPCSSPASCSLRPMSTTFFASSAMPSVSSSISVGRPVRK